MNPDTASVVARLAVDGGSGEDVGADKHGTRMAMIASAPHNDFGMVGVAPAQPYVSVRVVREGSSSSYFDDSRLAIWRCRQVAEEHNVRVMSLSLGRRGALQADAAQQLADAVLAARARGISVVAAAGNEPGPVDTPASYGPVLSVAAGAEGGVLCDFAAGGSEQRPPADLVAPGCRLDASSVTGAAVWANGSSHATAQTAAALAQLYSHRPDLMPDEAEALLIESATPTLGGPALNIAAAWRAAGLDALLAAGDAARPVVRDTAVDERPPLGEQLPDVGQPSGLSDQMPPESRQTLVAVVQPVAPIPGFTELPPPAVDDRRRAQWPRPRVKSFAYRRGILTIRTRSLPRGAELRVWVHVPRRGHEFSVLTTTGRSRTSRARIRVPQTWSRATVSVAGRGRAGSVATNIRPRAACLRACHR